VRWAPLAAFALFALVAAAWLSRDPAFRPKAVPAGSSLNEGPEGTALARAYLEKIGANPGALTIPLDQADLSSSVVLLRLDVAAGRDEHSAPGPDVHGPPEAKPAKSLAPLSPAEDAFVRSGGRLIVAVRGLEAKGALRKVAPLLQRVTSLEPVTPRGLGQAALVDAQPVFEHGEAVSIALRKLGLGEVWWLAEPEMLFNAHLGKADHLALLLALCAGRRPLFDEAAHGFSRDPGVLDLLRRWGFGPALLFGALAALAVFWRRSVIAGPPADPFRDPRSESVELVDSMASLYARALSPAQAVELYRTSVVREIALTLAVPEKRGAAVLASLAPDLLGARNPREQLSLIVSACERFRDEHRRRG